jgi:hypothetical protein
VKNTPILVFTGTFVAPFALMVNVTIGAVITGVWVVVAVVAAVVAVVVTDVFVVVVGVVVVVFWPQADTIIMASTMIMDTANENRFLLFI